MALKAVLFDLGDTLLDFGKFDPWGTFRLGSDLVHGYLVERGHSLPESEAYYGGMFRCVRRARLWSMVRRREIDVFEVLGRYHGRLGIRLDRAGLQGLIDVFYQPLADQGRRAAETPEVLKTLQGWGLRLGIVSNTFVPGKTLDGHLERDGLLSFFPVRIYSCDIRFMKPDRRIFEHALRAVGVGAEETMFVGDTPVADVFGAKRLGMVSVWRRGYRPAHRKAHPDHTIRELVELPDILKDYVKP
jgi:HAD superfamily hydrolase (TIGR01549 family)